jgi:hypothetical protein
MLTDLYATITKPFREALPLPELALWIVIYALVAFALWDVLRILASFLSTAIEETV